MSREDSNFKGVRSLYLTFLILSFFMQSHRLKHRPPIPYLIPDNRRLVASVRIALDCEKENRTLFFAFFLLK